MKANGGSGYSPKMVDLRYIFKVMLALDICVYPLVNKHRPWQIGVGRLVKPLTIGDFQDLCLFTRGYD